MPTSETYNAESVANAGRPSAISLSLVAPMRSDQVSRVHADDLAGDRGALIGG